MTCSAPQNDCLIFSFVKDRKVGVEKMPRNRCKMIEKTADSLLVVCIAFNFWLSSYYSLVLNYKLFISFLTK